MSIDAGTTPSSSSSSTTATYWLRQLQGSLTQELVKLTRHNDSLREKCAQLTREAEDACALERQLQENEEVYQQQVSIYLLNHSFICMYAMFYDET